MSISFVVCMSLWLFFMLVWVYFGPIRKDWWLSLPFPFIAIGCVLIGLILHFMEVK